MAAGDRHILATSGGFRMGPRNGWEVGPLIDHALALSGRDAGHASATSGTAAR